MDFLHSTPPSNFMSEEYKEKPFLHIDNDFYQALFEQNMFSPVTLAW